ncbi:hypothetical protein Tco_0600007 [Tanacetum coccineum]|uniref:Copia protein n=1 Tax=Tanacetum coccineum TaxID=301880 RepID=A0ABQ4WAK9_9ASTR
MKDGIFFNQSKYIKKMLKKFGLEDSKPTKTSMSTKIKLTKDDEADSVDNFKYRGMIGSLLYLTAGTGIETIVYTDSDHAGDYVDRKSTSGVCTFMGCCLTSWFSKKQTALAISTTEAEYISAGKACQQALWMKQALIDYDIRLDDVPIMRDNKGVIDLKMSFKTFAFHRVIKITQILLLRDNLPPNIKDWELIIRENVICVETHKSSIDACSDIMLYHLKKSQDFNFAYFIAHKIESVKNRVDCPFPYGLLITRLYRLVLAKLFRPYHTLQFVMHYRMMSSINRKNEKKRNESEEVKLDIPYSPSSVESSNQSSPLLGYWSSVDQF